MSPSTKTVRGVPLLSGTLNEIFHSELGCRAGSWPRLATCIVKTIEEVPAGDGNGSATSTAVTSSCALAGAPVWLPAGSVMAVTPGRVQALWCEVTAAAEATSPQWPLVPAALVAVT